MVGERIKKRRLELGMTQRGLASRTGVTVSTVLRWERSRFVPVNRLTPIADALSTTVAHLIGGDDEHAGS